MGGEQLSGALVSSSPAGQRPGDSCCDCSLGEASASEGASCSGDGVACRAVSLRLEWSFGEMGDEQPSPSSASKLYVQWDLVGTVGLGGNY